MPRGQTSVEFSIIEGVDLLPYLAKGAQSAGWNVRPDLAMAVSIPLIAGAVWIGVRRLHREAQAAAI